MTASTDRPTVLVVVGTRPEAIKLAPVILALEQRPDVRVRVVLTGQHDTLVASMLRTFGITEDVNLALMRPGQTLYDLARGCMEGLRDIISDEAPDTVVVQGDTASVFFGALVGFLEDVPVAHVEAGLRSGNMRQPFPEEGFRRLTGVLARWHFAPTDRARRALLAEGIPEAQIHRVGNTVVDALQTIQRMALPVGNPILQARIEASQANPAAHPWALLTTHRRESQGPPMRRVFEAVRTLAEEDALDILYPVHPNPAVREPAEAILGGHPRVHLVDPLDYPDLVHALASATLVLTDSGGIQEEAPTFGTPVLVLREVTERPEGVEAGVSRLVGTDPAAILQSARELLEAARTKAERGAGNRPAAIPNPYGDGRAAERIVAILLRDLGVASVEDKGALQPDSVQPPTAP
jgi:UDP-N-acetylglucosamine 2-epimerase (non-hydrolysing)